MFPWVNGFEWQPGHLIFLGLFFTVAAGIGATLAAALARTGRDPGTEHAESIRWRADFAVLPRSARLCRATFAGGDRRVCSNGFECSTCPAFEPGNSAALECSPDDGDVVVNGLRYPLDRAYHRGHTWVRQESNGTMTVGLDEMASRLVGTTDAVELPGTGTVLRTNGTAMRLRRNGSLFRILSPVSGRVIAHGPAGCGWLLRVRTEEPAPSLRHLLQGRDEVHGWVVREMERLQVGPGDGGIGVALADGGELVPDLSSTLPHRQWEDLCGEMLMDL
jgi:glycine cleavage system H protein